MRIQQSVSPRVGVVCLAVGLGLAGCATGPKIVPAPTPSHYATSPELLFFLMERSAEYRATRADLEVRRAYFLRMLEQPSSRATTGDPYAPARSGVEKLAAAAGFRKLTAEIAELDRVWRWLLTDFLGNAPSADDFDARANALSLPEGELALYAGLFQLQTRR